MTAKALSEPAVFTALRKRLHKESAPGNVLGSALSAIAGDRVLHFALRRSTRA